MEDDDAPLMTDSLQSRLTAAGAGDPIYLYSEIDIPRTAMGKREGGLVTAGQESMEGSQSLHYS